MLLGDRAVPQNSSLPYKPFIKTIEEIRVKGRKEGEVELYKNYTIQGSQDES